MDTDDQNGAAKQHITTSTSMRTSSASINSPQYHPRLAPRISQLRGAAGIPDTSVMTQYHHLQSDPSVPTAATSNNDISSNSPLPLQPKQHARRPETMLYGLNIRDISSPLQHASQLDDANSPAPQFNSPPLDPVSLATVVSPVMSAESEDEGGLFMSTPSGGSHRHHHIFEAATPGDSPDISPLNSGSVTPRMLEDPVAESADPGVEKGHQNPAVAISNFDANYLAAMGKDNNSISIRVDGRTRAKNLLRRLEGRSEAGGILSNLIRLQSIMTSSQQNNANSSSSGTVKPRGNKRPATTESPPSVHKSWATLPNMLRSFTQNSGLRSSGPDISSSEQSGEATGHSGILGKPPAGGGRSSPGICSGHGLPKSYSSARVSALMMTPEALAKNGIIPPPSTQSSLMRSDNRFSAGYFELGGSISAASSPGQQTMQHSADSRAPLLPDERMDLIEKIAQILEKQDFLMHLARAWHAFGSPVHRMEANLLEVARYLDIEACFFTIPGLTLISFGDPDTHSSETHIVRASDSYDMHRLEMANQISRRLRKGNSTVHESIRDIEALLAAPPLYPWYLRVAVCFVQSFCVSATLFHGSWKEAALSGAMGLVAGIFEQLSSEYLTVGYLLNVLPPLIVALVTAVLSDHICFAAVPMAATINLLPGLGLALAMMELSSSNIICGAVRLIAATMTSFMIGWGTVVGYNLGMAALGREGQEMGFASYSSCEAMSMWWWFLFVPLSTIGFSIWFKVHWKQWPAMIFAASAGLVIQTYCDKVKVMQPISAGLASFAVGVFGNVYGRVFHCATNADIVFVGIIQLVPGSTGVRGFISFISEDTSASSLTMSMLSTSISIAVGLLLSNGALYSELMRFKLGSF